MQKLNKVFRMWFMDKIERDAKLIEDLGGPAAVAEKLGYDKKKGGIQRVYNWTFRGIPSLVLLQSSDVFILTEEQKQEVA